MVGDADSLELWKKSCAAWLYFHLVDLHAVITEANKTCYSNYTVKRIIPLDLAGTFYLFLRNTMKEEILNMTSLWALCSTKMVVAAGLACTHAWLEPIWSMYMSYVTASRDSLRLHRRSFGFDGSLVMDHEGSLLQKVTPYSVSRTMIIICTWSLHI